MPRERPKKEQKNKQTNKQTKKKQTKKNSRFCGKKKKKENGDSKILKPNLMVTKGKMWGRRVRLGGWDDIHTLLYIRPAVQHGVITQ